MSEGMLCDSRMEVLLLLGTDSIDIGSAPSKSKLRPEGKEAGHDQDLVMMRQINWHRNDENRASPKMRRNSLG